MGAAAWVAQCSTATNCFGLGTTDLRRVQALRTSSCTGPIGATSARPQPLRLRLRSAGGALWTRRYPLAYGAPLTLGGRLAFRQPASDHLMSHPQLHSPTWCSLDAIAALFPRSWHLII